MTRYNISPVHRDKNWFYLENGEFFDVPTNIILSGVLLLGFVSFCFLLSGFYNVFLVVMLLDLTLVFWKREHLKKIKTFYAPVKNIRIPIQTVQGLLNQQIEEEVIPHQPTQLYLAIMGLVSSPKDLNLPVQLAQILIFSTAIASYYQHNLSKSYRKIPKEREPTKEAEPQEDVEKTTQNNQEAEEKVPLIQRIDDMLYALILRIDPMTFSPIKF
jgi:hypothetical protein